MVSAGDCPLLCAACYQSTKVEYLQVLVYMKGATKMSWEQDLSLASWELCLLGGYWQCLVPKGSSAIKLLEPFEENCGFSCLMILDPWYG